MSQHMSSPVILFEPAYGSVILRYQKVASDIGINLFFCSSDKELTSRYPEHIIEINKAWGAERILDALIEKCGQEIIIFTLNELCLPKFGEIRKIQKKKYGVVYPNSEEVYLKGRSKRHMKEQWLKSCVKTPRAHIYTSKSSLQSEIHGVHYPAIIKPISGVASGGVFKVLNVDELNAAIRKIDLLNNLVLKNTGAQDVGFVLEEYVDGDEYSVDTLWMDGRPISHIVRSRNKMNGPTFPDFLYYCDPYLSDHIKAGVIGHSMRAVRALGICSGNTHTEVRVKTCSPGESEFYVIECAPRVGGAGLSTQLFDLCTNGSFTRDSLLVESNRGDEIKAEAGQARSPAASALYYYCFIVPNGKCGRIRKICNMETLSRLPFVLGWDLLVSEGMYIGPTETNTGYWLRVTGAANSYSEILRQLDEIVALPILEF